MHRNCKMHFIKDDFLPSDVRGRACLKKHAVPSVKVSPVIDLTSSEVVKDENSTQPMLQSDRKRVRSLKDKKGDFASSCDLKKKEPSESIMYVSPENVKGIGKNTNLSNRTTCVGCGKRGEIGYHRLPNDPALRKIWLQRCDVDPSTHIAPTAQICHMHFTEDDFIKTNNRVILKKHAIPSVKVEPYKPPPRHYKTYCTLCGTLDGENRSIFYMPNDSKIRKKWLKNIGISVNDFNEIPLRGVRLCDHHFNEADVTIQPQTKNRRLRPGAVPLVTSINTRKYSSKQDRTFNSSKRDVTFVSSCSSNKMRNVTLSDDAEDEQPAESKNSETKRSKKLLKNSKSVAALSDRKDVCFTVDLTSEGNKWQLKDVCFTVDLTSEDVEGSNPPKSVPERNSKPIHRSKERTVPLERDLSEHRQEPLKSKTSEVNSPPEKPSQYSNSKAVVAGSSSSVENISGKKRRHDVSITSLSKKEDVTLLRTCEEVNDTNLQESELQKKRNRIRRLKQKISHFEEEIADYKNLLNSLISKELVTKEGKKMIKKFIRRNVEAT